MVTLQFLQTDQRARGGWGADILACIRVLQAETTVEEFTLQNFYTRFVPEMASRYLQNRNLEAKIRQQLQVLRDGGVITFLEPGRYRVIG